MTNKKLLFKLAPQNILISILIFIVIFGLSLKINTYIHQVYLINQLTEHAQLLANSYIDSNVNNRPEEFDYTSRFYQDAFNAAVVITSTNHVILYDSDHLFTANSSSKLSTLQDYVVDTALSGRLGKSKHAFTKYLEQGVFAVAVPLYLKNNMIGVLINISNTDTMPGSKQVIVLMSILTIIGIFTLLMISYSLYNRKSRKVVIDFARVTTELSNGNFEARISNKYMLSPEYSDISNNINQMAGELSKLEEMRREFIANISHDFRSPLTSIKGFVQAMLDGTIAKENQEKYLNIVLDESERLTSLTNDLLILSLIQSNNYPLEKIIFDIHEVIRKVAMQFEQKFVHKNIVLNLKFSKNELLVYADLNQIYRVLYNILDNAIKFSLELGEISIETYTIDHKATVIISDKGEGISPESLKHIWDRFYKNDKSRGKDKKGVGLGLSIVQEIIRAHDEKINVFSEPGKGTTFAFTLSIANK